MVQLEDFTAANIGPETLARLVRDEVIVRPTRGLCQLSNISVEATHVLAAAAVMVPEGIICMTSALQFHGQTLQMPSAVWMAIDRTAWRPKITYPPIRFVHFRELALTEGDQTALDRRH